jgi:hypothetical protein
MTGVELHECHMSVSDANTVTRNKYTQVADR